MNYLIAIAVSCWVIFALNYLFAEIRAAAELKRFRTKAARSQGLVIKFVRFLIGCVVILFIVSCGYVALTDSPTKINGLVVSVIVAMFITWIRKPKTKILNFKQYPKPSREKERIEPHFSK